MSVWPESHSNLEKVQEEETRNEVVVRKEKHDVPGNMAVLLNNHSNLKKVQEEAKRAEAAVRREEDNVPELISLEQDEKASRRRRTIAQGASCCSRMVLTVLPPHPMCSI